MVSAIRPEIKGEVLDVLSLRVLYSMSKVYTLSLSDRVFHSVAPLSSRYGTVKVYTTPWLPCLMYNLSLDDMQQDASYGYICCDAISWVQPYLAAYLLATSSMC